MAMMRVILAAVSLMLPFSAGFAQNPAPTPAIDVYDGFESSTLGPLWETDRFAPGAVVLQSEFVRAGHSAARITLHAGEIFEAGQHGNSDSERAELLEARRLVSREQVPYEQSFSMFLPAEFPIVPVRLVIAQWKQFCPSATGPCSDDSPVLAIRYIGGKLSVTQDLGGRFIVLFPESADLRNKWLDFRFRMLFSPTGSGKVEAWLNGRQIVDFKGITANPETAATGYPSPSHFYFKMGLYRNVMPQPMTIYIDEYRKRQLSANSPETGGKP